MKNIKNLNEFTSLKVGKLNEDVIDMGDTLSLREFNVPKSLIASLKKKAKDAGKAVDGKFPDNQIVELIGRYIEKTYLTIDKLPLTVFGADYADLSVVQPVQETPVQETPVQTDGANVQADATAQEIPQAQDNVQGTQNAQGTQVVQSQTQTQPQSTQAI